MLSMLSSHERALRPDRMVRIALALLLLGSAGCPYWVTFREGSVRPCRGCPTTPKARLSISLSLEGIEHESAGREETVRAYTDCGLVSVAGSDQRPNVVVEINLSRKHEDRAGTGVVIDIFFGLIPIHHDTDTYQTTTTFTSESGDRISISQTEKAETWSHLLLIPLFPFMNPWRVERRIYYDLARQTILEAYQAGAFPE